MSTEETQEPKAPEQKYPLFRVRTAYQRGTRLSATQRTSSRFDPEPLFLGRRLRPGQPPLEFGRKDFEANEIRIIQLLASGSITLEVKRDEQDDWDEVLRPTPAQLAEIRNQAGKQGDGKLAPATEELLEEAEGNGPAPTPEKPEPVLVTPAPTPPEGYAADPAGFADALELAGDTAAAATIREAEGITPPVAEEVASVTAPVDPTPTPAVEATPAQAEEKKQGGKKKGKG